jgi:hypothetical protein
MDVDKELDELFNDPLLNISDKESKLFDMPDDMKNVIKEKKHPDYVAQRKVCEDFASFAPLFKEVHADLKAGRRSLLKISKTATLEKGRFFIVGGQLSYLADIGETHLSTNHLIDGRTRCIFEDGTESDILLQTLRKSVVGEGYGITETQDEANKVFFNNSDLSKTDKVTGYIYVLRSLSDVPEIKNQPNLYKIGFTTQEVEERIANAVHQPTYLMAPVKIVDKYKVVNLNSHILETLIHQLLDAVNFHITVTDDNGEVHTPSEWYVVPIDIVKTIIEKIVDGSIINYTYNAKEQCLEKHIKKLKSQFNLSGLRVLTLNIKKIYFDEIMSGEKDIEYRELKQTTLNKYTYIDEADGKRYLRSYDVLHLYVGYHKDRESAIVEITDITYNAQSSVVEYHLGKILEKLEIED